MQSIFRPTRTLTGLAVVTAALTAFTAATPPMAVAANTSASACLNGYSGPYAVVNSYGGISLKCGDTTKGVIHIDMSHPISESGADDVNINECMNNIIAYGTPIDASSGNSAKRWRTPSSVYAYVVWRTSAKDVVTMYTSGTPGNRWDLCD